MAGFQFPLSSPQSPLAGTQSPLVGPQYLLDGPQTLSLILGTLKFCYVHLVGTEEFLPILQDFVPYRGH